MSAVALQITSKRSALVPPECPFNFADVDATGGQLVRVAGPPRYPRWFAEYTAVLDVRPCPWCKLPVHEPHCVAIMEDGEWRWAHPTCALTAKGGKSDIVPNAPWRRKQRPLCVCGMEWDQHAFADWKRWCDDDCSIEYKAAA